MGDLKAFPGAQSQEAIQQELAKTNPGQFLGTVCHCSTGRLGVVTGIRHLAWGVSYVGIALDADPNGPPAQKLWASKNPHVVFPTLGDYHDQLVAEKVHDNVQ